MFNAQTVKELRDKTGAGMMDCKKALEATNGNMDEAITWLREKGIAKAAKKAERIAAEGLSLAVENGNKAVILEINCETDFVAKNEELKTLALNIAETLLDSDVKTVEEVNNVMLNDGVSVNDAIVALTAKIGEKISFRRFEKIEKTDSQAYGIYSHMGGKITTLVVLDNTNKDVAKDVAMHAAAMRPAYVFSKDIPEDVLNSEREVYKEQSINEGKTPEIAEKMVEGRIKKYYKEVCLADQPFVKEASLSVEQYVKNNGGSIISMVRYEVGEGMEKRSDNFAEEVASQING